MLSFNQPCSPVPSMSNIYVMFEREHKNIIVYHNDFAFVRISLTRALGKDFFERILPMRRLLENSLDEGTTSRLTLFFSQLNLDAGEVIESTFTSSMARETRYREENNREAE